MTRSSGRAGGPSAGAAPAAGPLPRRASRSDGRCSPEGRRAQRLAVGVGFRKAATPDDLTALVRDALSRLPADAAGLPAVLATVAEKDRPVFRETAGVLGLPALALPKAALAGTGDRITVASEAARICLGVPSVAEAAALAAAGPGAWLVVPRISIPTATCAIAAAGSPEATSPEAT